MVTKLVTSQEGILWYKFEGPSRYGNQAGNFTGGEFIV